MIELPNVTLCCVDTKHHRLAVRSLRQSMRNIRFGRVILLTDAVPEDIEVPSLVEVRPIAQLTSHESYSEFVLKQLLHHIDTQFALVTQWDGYVVNASAWDPMFLACDYLGARWPDADPRANVGNGGFSLRSRKLLLALQDERVKLDANEDQIICSVCRGLLEQEYGIRFGSPDAADRFSFEIDQSVPLSGRVTFGFHGVFNLFLVESQSELVEFARQLSDDVARSLMCLYLLRNCHNFKQCQAAAALGARILASEPANEEVSAIVANAEAMLRIEERRPSEH